MTKIEIINQLYYGYHVEREDLETIRHTLASLLDDVHKRLTQEVNN